MSMFIRGNDDGNAVLTSLVLIIILSTLFVTFVPRITATKSFYSEYKTRILHEISQQNREVIEHYDLH